MASVVATTRRVTTTGTTVLLIGKQLELDNGILFPTLLARFRVVSSLVVSSIGFRVVVVVAAAAAAAAIAICFRQGVPSIA